MFQQTKALFFYCISPVHMGSGQALGLIDNPIQREAHTGWPVFAGSGIKGAARHQLRTLKWTIEKLSEYFGPESSGDTGYAGAVSFADAQLVAFPVRSLKRGYVYATCLTALARAKRILEIAGAKPEWQTSDIADDAAFVGNDELLQGAEIILEALAFTATSLPWVGEIGAWLGERALPQDQAYFRDKLAKDLVILSDTDFTHFAKHSTLVEPHVCIDPDTGTAKGTGLFYTENLPPESLLIAPLMASQTRTGKKKEDKETWENSAQDVLIKLTSLLTARPLLQLGGDATTGRGLVLAKVVEG